MGESVSNSEAHSCQRKLKRRSLPGVVDVYESISGTYLGRLVNVHQEGLMLMGDVPMHADDLYQLDLHVSGRDEEKKIISLNVDCVWVRVAEDNRKHWSGFHILDPSAEIREELELLVSVLEE